MTETSPPVLDPTKRDSFQFWTAVSIRFSDQDPLGHINNVAYAAYIEAARTMFLGGLLNSKKHPAIDFLLASVKIDYIKEAHYPGIIDVGAHLVRIGKKSITTGYGVFSGDQCIATSESTNVFFDTKSHRTVTVPDDVRAALFADPLQKNRSSNYSRSHSRQDADSLKNRDS